MTTLRHKTGIAGAVAREILRAEQLENMGAANSPRVDGLAYKAEFDRQGSNALKHCAAQAADCAAMEFLTPGANSRRAMSHAGFALLEAGRGLQ